MATLSRTLDILVVGAGQAGLALGYHLKTTLFTFQIVDCHRRNIFHFPGSPLHPVVSDEPAETRPTRMA
ncbi:MAG: hypothetical protein E6J10_12465 [Chloroflexi bacterium]|nr:MAG: hypothetical protein E6J10_12465 [Chloroflexota bacterium]